MKNLKMFCLSLEPGHYEFIKRLRYIPVGLGEKIFSKNWFTDKSGVNISEKNKYPLRAAIVRKETDRAPAKGRRGAC